MAALTPRGKALHRMSTHRGIVEEPHGSNTDNRPHEDDGRWGIRKAQESFGAWLVGQPWCGTWCGWALNAADVSGVSSRIASVALIEEDARAHRRPFHDWQPQSAWRKVTRGDLVVLFGRGVHVGMVRSFKTSGGRVYVVTSEGNTSSGTGGSQSNGGQSARRVRPLSDVHGFARVDYGKRGLGDALGRLAMRAEAVAALPEIPTSSPVPIQSSDVRLYEGLARSRAVSGEQFELRSALRAALKLDDGSVTL